jgi:hypothetical protein
MANSTSISSLITPEIAATLTSSDQIISFGDQLKKQASTIVIGVASTLLKNKLASLADIILKQKQAAVDRSVTIVKASRDYKNKKITNDQYTSIVKNANEAYQTAINTLKDNKQQTQQGLATENSVTKSIQAEAKKIKLENVKLKTDTIRADVKAKLDLAKQVLKNPKTLLLIYPGVGLLVTNALLSFIAQRKKLEKQVDVVNLYIDTRVIDEPSVLIATYLKNNTIKAIEDAITKLKAIEDILKTINTALKIASVALTIITVIMILVPAVPGAAVTLFTKLTTIVAGLSAIATICLSILSNEIQKLKELIKRLKQIIIKLNNKTLSILTDSQLLRLIQTILPVGDVNTFSTLTAVPISGSAGFVNISGRIVPLDSTSAINPTNFTVTSSGALPGTNINGNTVSSTGTTVPSTSGITGAGNIGTGVGTAGTSIGTSTGTGTGIGGTGIGTGTNIGTDTGAGTGISAGVGAGTGTGTGTASTTGTGTGTGTTGNGTGTGIGTTGTGTGITGTGTANNIIPKPIVTGSVGSTNGTGIGVTTTGGTGTGGINIGPTGVIPNNTGTGVNNIGGVNPNGGLALDNGINTGLDIDGQFTIPIDLDQLSIAGLDELTLDQLESFTLETLEDPQSQSLPSTSQVPSLQDQANLYKGFRFQIKEEQDPRFTVRGTIKRRYAVAINRQGVEVLKSEYSFTLDPNDLVDQLKLIIDKQKLQG